MKRIEKLYHDDKCMATLRMIARFDSELAENESYGAKLGYKYLFITRYEKSKQAVQRYLRNHTNSVLIFNRYDVSICEAFSRCVISTL